MQAKEQQRDPTPPFSPALIRSRLASYEKPAVEQVTAMLSAFLEWDIRRADSVDKKAHLTIGYAAALGTGLVPWLINMRMAEGTRVAADTWEILGYGVAIIVALVAVYLAFLAFRIRSGWSRLTDETLFPRPPASGFDETKTRSFWAVALHGLYRRNFAICNRKAALLLRAQVALVISILLVGVLFVSTIMSRSG